MIECKFWILIRKHEDDMYIKCLFLNGCVYWFFSLRHYWVSGQVEKLYLRKHGLRLGIIGYFTNALANCAFD